MTNQTDQIQQELQRLQKLANTAGFWKVGPPAKKADGWSELPVEFSGRVIAAAGPEADRVEYSSQQKLRLLLPSDFPSSAPQVQLDTPVFHPNVPADGLISMPDVGLEWSPQVSLDMVLEKVWDTMRCQFVDTESAVNVGAREWYDSQSQRFPVDSRRLTGDTDPARNIIRYRRKGRPVRRSDPIERIVIDGQTGSSDHEPPTAETPIHYID